MAQSTANAALNARAEEVNLEGSCGPSGSSTEDLRQWVLACRRSARSALDCQLFRALGERGHDARALCSPELTASLSDVTICELLQMITLGGKDAIVEVFHGPSTSRLWCSGGKIVDARSGRLDGEVAVYRILALERGEVVADFRAVRRGGSIGSSTHALILESLRRKDECAVIEKRLGGLDRVYKTAAGARAKIGPQGLSADLLNAFDAGTRIDAVLACSSLDDLAMLQAIEGLVTSGQLMAGEKMNPVPPRITVALAANEVPQPRFLTRLQHVARGWGIPLTGAALAVGVLAASWGLRRTAQREASRDMTELAHDRSSAAEQDGILPQPARLLSKTAALSLRAPAAEMPAASNATYAIQLLVEPPQAELWLDGKWVAAGDLAMQMLRDGRTHELRIAAAEHRAQTFVFCDVSPPRAVILERESADPQEERQEVWSADSP